MMDKNTLKQIIREQKEIFDKDLNFIVRNIPENFVSSDKIIVITGIRRSGKSTLLRQIAKRHENYYYFNFEDERLIEFNYEDFNILLQAFYEDNRNSKTFFFDEIQNVIGWEKFVRRLFNEGNKIYVTGSNAKLLSSEIATSLTGRNLKFQLYTFSFLEYLKFVDFPVKEIYTTKEKAYLSNYLTDYIKYGGFPEVVKSKDKEDIINLYQDILVRDLIVRFRIKDVKEFRELALYLLSNTAKKFSYGNIKKLLNFSNVSKVKNYVDFLSESYLLFPLLKFDYSIKKQIVANRKIYSVDSGIINFVSFQFNEDLGRLIENLVFLEFKRQNCDIFYFENDLGECDFVIKKGLKIVQAIQVTYNLSNPQTREREIRGIEAAMKEFNLKEGVIISLDEESFIKEKNIKIIPLWKFLIYGL